MDTKIYKVLAEVAAVEIIRLHGELKETEAALLSSEEMCKEHHDENKELHDLIGELDSKMTKKEFLKRYAKRFVF